MTPDRAYRYGGLRATVLAGFCAALTAAGHLAGGGRLPELTVLVVLLPLLAGVFTTLAQRARGATGTLVVLGMGQLALHELIGLLNPSHPAHHVVAPAAPNELGMLAGHAVATVVIGVTLRHADGALARLAAALRRVLPRRPPTLRADRPLATRPTPGPAVGLRLLHTLAAAQVRRGPPVGC